MATKLTTCNNSFEAELIKGRLESEGIGCVLQGEGVSVLYGGIGAMPVNVLVCEEDLEKAKSIIEDQD
ncbi:MAG: DUF2007 domain-containing protein [Bacteroidaceae bacterium]|nr:DUF2007 domain-containing protein [Bacteroidaceae bacterium]